VDFNNKRVTIIGLSESGFSAAKLLKKLNAKVRISELRDEDDVRRKLKILGGVEFELGVHTKRFIEKSDFIVTSPGVPPSAELLQWAAVCGIPVISELELGYMFCAAPIVAITGTNGKSTTAYILHEMFKTNGIKSHLLGNIGRPICEDILDIPSESIVILEVSSFQLETIKRFRPKIAVFLNFTQDHLDRYQNMNEYRKAKLRIFENQDVCDYAILNYDSPVIRGFSDRIHSQVFYFSIVHKVKGCYVESGRLFVDLGQGPTEICRKEDVALQGAYNLENILAAALALKLIDNRAEVLFTIKNFIGLRHRFELVAEIGGVKFIDDSKSTTVDSTLRALELFSENNVVLIAGGKDKGSNYSLLTNLIKKLKCLILIGEAKKKIRDALVGSDILIEEAATMQEAVSLAIGVAKEGEVIILSPMCSSFDMFRDYKERGEVFRRAVFDSLIKSRRF
jgi:UDP-N-acetylmuramoylalanine--D-glutamate ligase